MKATRKRHSSGADMLCSSTRRFNVWPRGLLPRVLLNALPFNILLFFRRLGLPPLVSFLCHFKLNNFSCMLLGLVAQRRKSLWIRRLTFCGSGLQTGGVLSKQTTLAISKEFLAFPYMIVIICSHATHLFHTCSFAVIVLGSMQTDFKDFLLSKTC